MAGFAKVMKQAARMCRAARMCSNPQYDDGCGACRLDGGLCARTPREWTAERITEFERVVMNWAVAHPEPVYPTWREYIYDYCTKLNPDLRGCNDYQFVAAFMSERIPADIAEKLGVEPKEGT